MSANRYQSLNVNDDTHERMKAYRDEHGHNGMDGAVSELLDRVEGEPEPITLDEATIEQLVDELGAAGGGPTVDDSDIAREVAARIDYAELARKTADKIRSDLR